MNEFVILGVSIISGIFGLMGIQLLQQNWFKREDLKFKYDVKRAKLRKKNIPVKKTSSPTTASDWISLLRGINPEIAHSVIDGIQQSDEYMDEQGNPIAGAVQGFIKQNPDMVMNFLNGLSDNIGQKGQQGAELIR